MSITGNFLKSRGRLDFRNGISFVIFVQQKTQNYEILEETNSTTYGSTWIAFVGCKFFEIY